MKSLEEKLDYLIRVIEQVNVSKQDIMTISDAALFLRRKPSTIRSWVAAKSIPFYKRNGTVYFLKSDLLAWIKRGRIKTQLEQMSDGI